MIYDRLNDKDKEKLILIGEGLLNSQKITDEDRKLLSKKRIELKIK